MILTLANYGLERGLNDVNCATSYDDVKAYTPAWAEQITGVSRSQIIRIAREFADNADKTHGRSMIIVGAGAEPLVSPRYELSWSDQHADFLRLCRSERGRLGALCRSGKTASANRLAAAGVCP